jgi:hypothetical protein
MSYTAPSGRARSLTLALTAILFLLAVGSPAADAAVRPEQINFESAGLAQFDQLNATVGSLAAVSGGYGDAYAARAAYSGGGQNGYARGIFNVDWNSGDDVWYSAAFYLPTGFKAAMQGQVALMRWDDYGAHPEAADYSGVVIYGGDKHARLVVDRIASGTQIELGPAFDLPEGRWFHLEVHQRLGAASGVNDVFLDGNLVSSGGKPNLEPGRGVDRIRYGIVAIASGAQTRPLSLQFDNATVSTRQVGPDPALRQPGASPRPASAHVAAARYPARVRKCIRHARKRALRSTDAGFLARATRRCAATYGHSAAR